PNLYFLSKARATVKCDLLASSNVSTTSLSGMTSAPLASDVAKMNRKYADKEYFMASCRPLTRLAISRTRQVIAAGYPRRRPVIDNSSFAKSCFCKSCDRQDKGCVLSEACWVGQCSTCRLSGGRIRLENQRV